MEGICCYSPSSSSSQLQFRVKISSLAHFSSSGFRFVSFSPGFWRSNSHYRRWSKAASLRTSTLVVEETVEKQPVGKETMPKMDKSGRFCSPRAARELALIIAYAACLEGSDPVRLFEKRMNTREPGYEFDRASLLEYDHMDFSGEPVRTKSVEEADEMMRDINKQSAIDGEVLSAPPKLVYSKLLLRFTRKLLVAVVDSWNDHVAVIDKIVPENWKNEPASKILELCILHLAMSEMVVVGTRHQIVINEAVDLAKRFCDGAAPRIINGCLRTFLKDSTVAVENEASKAKQQVWVKV